MKSVEHGLTPILALLLVAALAYSISAYFAMTAVRATFYEKTAALAEAQQIYRTNQSQSAAISPAQQPLKALVQQSSGRNGVNLTYLSEMEKDLEQGVHERSVICRASNVPQGKLVSFLRELEQNGGGARVKEIRLKLSPDHSNEYQEVETTLALRSFTPIASALTPGGR